MTRWAMLVLILVIAVRCSQGPVLAQLGTTGVGRRGSGAPATTIIDRDKVPLLDVGTKYLLSV